MIFLVLIAVLACFALYVYAREIYFRAPRFPLTVTNLSKGSKGSITKLMRTGHTVRYVSMKPLIVLDKFCTVLRNSLDTWRIGYPLNFSLDSILRLTVANMQRSARLLRKLNVSRHIIKFRKESMLRNFRAHYPKPLRVACLDFVNFFRIPCALGVP